MKIQYCDKCKENNDRVAQGYNPRGENCGKLMCNFLHYFHLIMALIIIVPLIIVLIFTLPIFWIHDIFYKGD